MTGKKNSPPPSAGPAADSPGILLRRKAEAVLQIQHGDRPPVTPEDAQRLLHELEVHQIELEMQNHELRRAQEQLEASRLRYFDLYDLAPVGYFNLSEKGLILQVNLTACLLLGQDRRNLVMQPLSRFILRDDAERYFLYNKKLFATGEAQACEIRMLRQDGDPFWVLIEAIAAQDCEIGAPVCRAVMSDISKRKQEEEALRESEARFRSYFDLPLHGIAITSINKGWLQVNDRLCSILGYSREEILRMTWEEMTHPDDLARDCAHFNKLLSGFIDQYMLEKRFIRKDGGIVWTSLGVGCVRKADGSVNYIIALVEDINVRKKFDHDLQEKNAELERFTLAVSHDLKIPLVTIRTFLGHLVEDMAQGEKDRVTQDLAYVHTAAEKMNELLDELLKLSQVGRVTNPSVETPLQDIVREALGLTAGSIDKRGARVTVTEKPVMLYGDRVRLVDVFQNLVDNAVKFMGDQKEPLIEIGIENKGSNIMCFVRDNGMGIDQQHTDKLFGLFEKLNSGMEGSGMGLALVKRIIEVHGGRVWFESDGPGAGACCCFTLPVKSSEKD